MSTKKLDWNSLFHGENHGKNRGKYGSYKEMMNTREAAAATAQASAAQFKQLEPLLKKALFEHLMNRTPITVLAPITYFTDSLSKSEDEETDDDKFYNTKKRNESLGSFDTVPAVIPVGTELTFSRRDGTFNQWIFKGNDGKDYEIYETPVVAIPGRGGASQQIQNPAFYGLLLSTSIYTGVMDELNEKAD